VTFSSDVHPARWRGTLHLPATATSAVAIDLRQVYAFALARSVSDVRLTVVSPGRYRVRTLELSR